MKRPSQTFRATLYARLLSMASVGFGEPPEQLSMVKVGILGAATIARKNIRALASADGIGEDQGGFCHGARQVSCRIILEPAGGITSTQAQRN